MVSFSHGLLDRLLGVERVARYLQEERGRTLWQRTVALWCCCRFAGADFSYKRCFPNYRTLWHFRAFFFWLYRLFDVTEFLPHDGSSLD